jgi:hypothetical protein
MSSEKWRHRKARAWSSLQIVFLAVAVVAPLWVTNNQRLLPELSEARLRASDALRPSTITSSTLVLPNPDQLKTEKPLEFESRSRQVRLAQTPLSDRSPASRGDLWVLSRIDRLGPLVEKVSLLASQPPSTEFLEISDGLNRFQVSFRSASGLLAQYELHIHYKSRN